MSKKSFIDSVRVENPCTQDWDEMTGNDQVRFCAHCAKDVNNLSTMTRKEAHRLVRRSNGRLCIRYIKNPQTNGPVFSDQLIQLSRRAPRMAAGIMSASLSLSALAYAQAGASPTESTTTISRINEKSCPDKTGKDKSETPSATETGQITGTITDPKGAVIPNASITLLDERGNLMRDARTNEDGYYGFDGISAGKYSVRADAANFRSTIMESVTLGQQETIVNISLEVEGNVTVGGVMVSIEYKGLLASAVSRDDIDEVRDLLARGENVNGKEEDGTTPLFIAVENGNIEIVQMLLNFGAKINARNKERETPLMRLDEDASTELVELLLRNGAKVNLTSKNGGSALMWAARYAKTEVLQVLINAGAEINIQDAEGQTALMNAAENDKLENVKALVIAGADVNLKDKEGDSAWDKTDNDEIEEFLVSHGAIVDEEDESNEDTAPTDN